MWGGFSTRQLEDNASDRIRALHLALDAPIEAGGSMAGPVAELLHNARLQGLDASLLVGGYQGRRLMTAGLIVQSPGRAALVFVPSFRRGAEVEAITIATLDELLRLAAARNLLLLQSLLISEASGSAFALSRAGFRFLTRLVYLERPMTRPAAPVRCGVALTWRHYEPAARALFLDALDATYVQTLDCPKLVGIRTTEDALDGHRATGVHDPSLWWVATADDGSPAGVLLLTALAGRATLEVVYVGVAQPFRAQGVGDALLACALEQCRRVSASALTLAVDEANHPARRLYDRWAFARIGVRDAWIATPLVA